MKRKRKQEGSALVIVVAASMIILLLVTGIVALSQSSRLMSVSTREMQEAYYLQESVVARTSWMLFQEMENYPDRSDLTPDETESIFEELERWGANGFLHTVSIGDVEFDVKVTDYNSGMTFTTSTPINELDYMESRLKVKDDSMLIDRFEILRNRMEDAWDSDDFTGDDGLEYKEYEDVGIYYMPRNEFPERREELEYLPGITEFFPLDSQGRLSYFQLLLPNLSDWQDRGKPQLLSISDQLLYDLLDYEEYSERSVREMMEKIRSRELLVSEAEESNPDLFQTFDELFSLQESGYYRLEITPADNSGLPKRMLEVILHIPTTPATADTPATFTFSFDMTSPWYWRYY